MHLVFVVCELSACDGGVACLPYILFFIYKQPSLSVLSMSINIKPLMKYEYSCRAYGTRDDFWGDALVVGDLFFLFANLFSTTSRGVTFL